ncbi:MAG: radical SAM protein, partial [Flavobacteriales bacterium]
MLKDQHGRTIDYLRLAVTDRCNLRCLYCMPQEGLNWEKRSALLSYEEIMRLLHIFSSQGITKLRFTGGEPFLRKDFMQLLRKTVEANLFEKISITTNGTLTSAWIPELKELGISGINLSADTFNPERFARLTRRDDFQEVKKTFDLLLKYEIPLRINA